MFKFELAMLEVGCINSKEKTLVMNFSLSILSIRSEALCEKVLFAFYFSVNCVYFNGLPAIITITIKFDIHYLR